MLTVICGEDSVSSRNYFLDLKKKLKNDLFEIYDIKSDQLDQITSWIADSNSLFSNKKIFFTEKINKKISKTNQKLNLIIKNLTESKDIEIYDWEEDLPGRYLKFDKTVKIKEFKPDQTIFKLLDSFYPKNAKYFLEILHSLPKNSDEIFVFIMLIRHVRNLILAYQDKLPTKMMSWQKAKLKKQASLFEEKNLINIYGNLHKIDISLKTSSSPYKAQDAIDILACYYL